MRVLVLTWLLGVALGEGGEKCDEKKLESMRKKFSDCSSRYLEEYVDTRDTFEGELYLKTAACLLLSNSVDKCGELWLECHAPRDVHRMRQLQLESLVDRYRQEVDLEHCEVVNKYGKARGEGQGCDDSQTLAAQNRFQECSHSSSTKAYSSIRGLSDVNLITEKFCSTLHDISTRCVENLQACFSQEDVKQLLNSNLEIMKKFLVRISKEKIANGGLDHCDAIKNVDKGNDTVVVKSMSGEVTENDDSRTVYTKIETTDPATDGSKTRVALTESFENVSENVTEPFKNVSKAVTESFIWSFVEDSDTDKSYSGDLDSGKMVIVTEKAKVTKVTKVTEKSEIAKVTKKLEIRKVTETSKMSSIPTTSQPSSTLEVEQLSRPTSGSGASTPASILVIVMSLAFVSVTVGLLVQAALGSCAKYQRPVEQAS